MSSRLRRNRSGEFLRAWRVELIALALVLLGLFLLLEQYDIAETMLRWGVEALQAVARVLSVVWNRIRAIHPSDLLGLVIIGVAVGLIIRRIGYRLQLSSALLSRACPSCGHTLRRTHRRSGDWLTWIFPLRRYACSECGWSGLRAQSPHEHVTG